MMLLHMVQHLTAHCLPLELGIEAGRPDCALLGVASGNDDGTTVDDGAVDGNDDGTTDGDKTVDITFDGA